MDKQQEADKRFKELERENYKLKKENDQLQALLQDHVENDILNNEIVRRTNRFESVFENSTLGKK